MISNPLDGSNWTIDPSLGLTAPLNRSENSRTAPGRCEHCIRGLMSVDLYGERVCISCGYRPVNRNTNESLKRKMAERQQLPGESRVKNPGNPESLIIALELMFPSRDEYAGHVARYTKRYADLVDPFRRVMKVTYLKETVGYKKEYFIPIRIEPKQPNFDWLYYRVMDLEIWVGRAFTGATGEYLTYLTEWLEDEKAKWNKAKGLNK